MTDASRHNIPADFPDIGARWFDEHGRPTEQVRRLVEALFHRTGGSRDRIRDTEHEVQTIQADLADYTRKQDELSDSSVADDNSENISDLRSELEALKARLANLADVDELAFAQSEAAQQVADLLAALQTQSDLASDLGERLGRAIAEIQELNEELVVLRAATLPEAIGEGLADSEVTLGVINGTPTFTGAVTFQSAVAMQGDLTVNTIEGASISAAQFGYLAGVTTFIGGLMNDANAATARNTLELGTSDTPTFAGATFGDGSDNTAIITLDGNGYDPTIGADATGLIFDIPGSSRGFRIENDNGALLSSNASGDLTALRDLSVTRDAAITGDLTCASVDAVGEVRASTLFLDLNAAGDFVTWDGPGYNAEGGLDSAGQYWNVTSGARGHRWQIAGTDVLKIDSGGVINYGTHTAIGSEALSGYITIKDSAGTSRKIGVVS